MKKIVIFTFFATWVFVANAQLTELHTFPAYSDWVKYNDLSPAYIIEESSAIYLYNWDFSLYKTITMTPPSGYTMYATYAYLMSKKFINNDDKIELFVQFYKDNNLDCKKLLLINEDGTIIQDFDTAFILDPLTFYTYNNETRINIYKATRINGELTSSVIVYRCGGPGKVSVPNANQETSLGNAYPNPTASMVTLPYHLSSSNSTAKIHIYDMSGKLVKTISVGPHFNEVMVDVSSFPSGMYIYECEGKTSKFIVK